MCARASVAETSPNLSRASARFHWLWLILFIALQIADIITTNHALANPGSWEVNPVMQLSQARLGGAWWIPKIAAVGFAVIVPRLGSRWPMMLVLSYYLILVIGNFLCFYTV